MFTSRQVCHLNSWTAGQYQISKYLRLNLFCWTMIWRILHNQTVLVGLQFSNKEKTMYKSNPLLRLGFTYSSGTNLMGGSFKEDRIPFDTLTSSQTGQTAFIDSINTQGYNMNYRSEQLRFDGSIIFRTNPEARWSLFTGIGITAGISINARTDIYYSNYGTAETTYADGTISSSPSYGYSYSNNGNI